MKWYNPQTEPFQISGFAFYEKDRVYRRMPLAGEGVLPDAVYGLADETAGGQIRFHGKLKKLCIRVSLAAKPGYFAEAKKAHMAFVTQSAFDLYLSEDGKDYVYYSVALGMDEHTRYYESKFFEFDEAVEYDFLLNFPLYGGVDKILIGVDDDAEISAPGYHFKDDKKIVLYGTSVQQGACAGRPGMDMANLISRLLDREVYNLGFNSSGKAEAEVAKVIAGIKDMGALIVSIEENCPDCDWLKLKLPAFLEIFRKEQPDTPVVIMPFIVSGKDTINPKQRVFRTECRRIQKRIVEEFRAKGDENVYLFLQEGEEQEWTSRKINGHSIWHECTVDGVHYNDLGFYWMSKALCGFLTKELKL